MILMIKINDYIKEEHNKALSEDDYNVSHSCDDQYVKMFCRIHSATEILFGEDGEVVYYVKGKPYPFQKGDILVIESLSHHERTINKLPYMRYGLTLMPHYIRNFIFDVNLLNVFRTLEPDEYERRCRGVDPVLFNRLITLLDDLYTEVDHEDMFSQLDRRLIIQQIAVTLYRAFRYNDSDRIAEDSYNMEKMRKVYDFINENYQEDISLDMLGSMFYMHPTNISKCFHKCYGMTLNKFINSVRICKAQYLLETTDMSVSAIADYTGFNSVNAFITKYREILNKTPLQYRKEFRMFKMNEGL